MRHPVWRQVLRRGSATPAEVTYLRSPRGQADLADCSGLEGMRVREHLNIAEGKPQHQGTRT